MVLCLAAQTLQVLNLANANLRLRWENSGSGWRIKTIAVKKGQTWVNLEQPSGEHTAGKHQNWADPGPDCRPQPPMGKKRA